MRYTPFPVPIDVENLSSFLKAELSRISAVLGNVDSSAAYMTLTELSSVDSPYSMGARENLVVVDTSSGNVAIDLPDIDIGRVVNIKKIVATNQITVTTPDTALIDGQVSKTILTRWENVTFACDGSDWYIV